MEADIHSAEKNKTWIRDKRWMFTCAYMEDTYVMWFIGRHVK